MTEEKEVREVVSPILKRLGYSLVQLRILGAKDKTLQIMSERIDGEKMSVDDCANISKEISVILDVNNPISGSYLLEISSPGVDRPLVSMSDFEFYAGFDARLDMNRLFYGRKKFKGKLLGIRENRVEIQDKNQTYMLPFSNISRAKLLLTPELIDATMQN